MDIVSPETRSRMMAGIRGRDTRPEIVVRRYLHAAGLRFRLGGCGLPGRPDIILASRRVAVFVHGCFWHRHAGCRFATTPATRADFWERKFAANIARDAIAASALAGLGWTSMTVWECETRSAEELDKLFWRIAAHGPE
jgi:DNA mismatch endonuclease, patch repair protein